jgi:transcriptional regulator with XRE-family HTH domain
VSIAERLREARRAQNLTFGELARAAGIASRQTIYNIETRRQAASVEQVARLAAALGCSPTWLAYGAEK